MKSEGVIVLVEVLGFLSFWKVIAYGYEMGKPSLGHIATQMNGKNVLFKFGFTSDFFSP